MLKKTRKQIITFGIAGIVSAGSLFSGITLNSVYALEDTQAVEASEVLSEQQESKTAEATSQEVNEGEAGKQEQNQDVAGEIGAESESDVSKKGAEKTASDAEKDTNENNNEKESAKQTSDTIKAYGESISEDTNTFQDKTIVLSAENVNESKTEDNVKAEMNQTAFPLNINMDLSKVSDMSWALSDKSVLSNTDVKLYKVNYSEYLNIIEKNGGLFEATQGAIWNELKNKAQLLEQWTAADNSHVLNLTEGDYYIAINDSMFGLNAPKVFFNISGDGKAMREYDMLPAVTDGTIAYKGEAQNISGALNVQLDGIDLWAKYVDPVVVTKSIGGQELTKETEIEIYRKDGEQLSKVDVTARNSGTTFFLEGSSYINTIMRHPGTYIIRCTKAPEGYAKFPDISVIVATNEYGYPELEIDNKNKNDAVIRGVYGGEVFYWHKNINPAVIEITMESENVLKTDIRIMTRADFSFFNLRHEGIENWADIAPEYGTAEGVENKLYRFSFDTWKKMVEEVTEIGGGGNAWIDNMRAAIKERGEYITSWISSGSQFTVSLKPSVYAVFNDTIRGNGRVTFFQVYEDGSVRYSPEYYSYISNLGFETFEWGKSGPVDEGNLIYHDIVYYENRDTVTFKLSDKNGNNITNGSVIELYRKEGEKLTKVSIEKAKGGHYEEEHFCGLLDYPGEFVIRCVSVPSGYRSFKDISFTVSRNGDGYPEYKITDNNGNTVYLKGIDLYGEYESPSYSAQETISALFDIVLDGNSRNEDRSSSGNTSAVQTVKTSNQPGTAAAGKTSAAKTGNTNFTAIYFAAAGAAAAVAGVAAYVLKKKRES